MIASCPQCPGERFGREQAFSHKLNGADGADEGCPGKTLSKKKIWNRAERGMAVRGEAGMHHRCPAAPVPVPGGRSSVARVGAGVAAAAEPPASAPQHGGSQMCACSAGRKTAFSCRNRISHPLISAQGSPRQTEELFL